MTEGPDIATPQEVTFGYGRRDLVDVCVRSARYDAGPLLRRLRWWLLGTLLPAGLTLLLCWSAGASHWLLWAAITALAGGQLALWHWNALVRREADVLVDAQWLPGAHHCTVRADQEGLHYRVPLAEETWPWPGVAKSHDYGDDLEIVSEWGLLIVRGRGFGSPGARESFVDAVERGIAWGKANRHRRE